MPKSRLRTAAEYVIAAMRLHLVGRFLHDRLGGAAQDPCVEAELNAEDREGRRDRGWPRPLRALGPEVSIDYTAHLEVLRQALRKAAKRGKLAANGDDECKKATCDHFAGDHYIDEAEGDNILAACMWKGRRGRNWLERYRWRFDGQRVLTPRGQFLVGLTAGGEVIKMRTSQWQHEHGQSEARLAPLGPLIDTTSFLCNVRRAARRALMRSTPATRLLLPPTPSAGACDLGQVLPGGPPLGKVLHKTVAVHLRRHLFAATPPVRGERYRRPLRSFSEYRFRPHRRPFGLRPQGEKWRTDRRIQGGKLASFDTRFTAQLLEVSWTTSQHARNTPKADAPPQEKMRCMSGAPAPEAPAASRRCRECSTN